MVKLIKKLIAGAMIVLGLGLLGYWGHRTFIRPTAADQDRLESMAKYGGVAANAPADPKKIYLLGGVACVALGGALWKQ